MSDSSTKVPEAQTRNVSEALLDRGDEQTSSVSFQKHSCMSPGAHGTSITPLHERQQGGKSQKQPSVHQQGAAGPALQPMPSKVRLWAVLCPLLPRTPCNLGHCHTAVFPYVDFPVFLLHPLKVILGSPLPTNECCPILDSESALGHIPNQPIFHQACC